MIESAKYLSRYCDVYKAEFPGTLGVESDSQLMDNLKRLNDACVKPWVLLSAGVDYDKYKKQVEMAMKAGASGVLGGRAFWKEFFTYPTPAERQKFAETRVRAPGEGNGRDREDRHAVVRQVRPDDGGTARHAGDRGLARPLRRRQGLSGPAGKVGPERGVLNFGERRGVSPTV